MAIKLLILHTLLIIDFSRTVINCWRIFIVFITLSKAAKGEIVISINSHPSMFTALSPGHKATNQIDKCAWFG